MYSLKMKVHPVLVLLFAHAVLGDTGGPHVHHHHHQALSNSVYSPRSQCGPSYSVGELKTGMQDLDYQLHQLLVSLPPAIQTAKAAIQSGNVDTNRDQIIVGIACFIGALSGSLGILYNKDPLTLTTADQISLIAMNSWGYGYWGPYLLELDETDPGCGVEDFNRVLYEYSFITSLQQVYGEDPGAVAQLPDNRPELRSYYLSEFGRKLKLALHCITSKADSVEEAAYVVSLIDKYVTLGTSRLQLTKRLM